MVCGAFWHGKLERGIFHTSKWSRAYQHLLLLARVLNKIYKFFQLIFVLHNNKAFISNLYGRLSVDRYAIILNFVIYANYFHEVKLQKTTMNLSPFKRTIMNFQKCKKLPWIYIVSENYHTPLMVKLKKMKMLFS